MNATKSCTDKQFIIRPGRNRALPWHLAKLMAGGKRVLDLTAFQATGNSSTWSTVAPDRPPFLLRDLGGPPSTPSTGNWNNTLSLVSNHVDLATHCGHLDKADTVKEPLIKP